jgi:hypothetical protein
MFNPDAQYGNEGVLAMRTKDRSDSVLFQSEEVNRARQTIQNRWTEAERSHRRQMAECRQQALVRLLGITPITKMQRVRQPA